MTSPPAPSERSWRLMAAMTGVALCAAAGPAAAATVHVSPSGSDANPCTAGAPCYSLDRGYRAAGPGDVVEVADGTYSGNQAVLADPSKADGPAVVVTPAPGARPRLDGLLRLYASHIEVRGMAIRQWAAEAGSRDITLRNLDTSAQSIIASARQVRVIGGDIGPVSSGDGIQIKPRDRGEPSPDDILIDGVRFHDVTGPADGQHRDCIQVGGATNLVVRNSSFERCADRDIIMGTFLGGVFGPTLIENNFFGPTVKSSVSVDAREAAVDLTFRYNSIGAHGVIIGTNNQRARGNRVVGNVGPLSSAHSGPGTCEQPSVATYSHNVWTNAKCSSTDRRAPSGYVNQAALDYRLAPGSAAIRAGDPNDHPERDIFGVERDPAAPSAGASEG